MTYLRFLLLMILAVLALTGPSLGVGITAMSVNKAPAAIALADDEARAPAFRPCARHGGKGVVPCHPDLGLPVVTAAAPLWTMTQVPMPSADLLLPERAPKIEPPPPRRR